MKHCWAKKLLAVFCFVVFFNDVGGASLDSHHGFVVEYGEDRDVDLGETYLAEIFQISLLNSVEYKQFLYKFVLQAFMWMIQK